MCNSLLVLWKLSVSQEPLNAIKGETLPSAVTVASVSVLCGIPSITIIAVNLEVNFSSFLMMHILLIPNLKLSRLCGGGIVFRNMQRYWKWMTTSNSSQLGKLTYLSRRRLLSSVTATAVSLGLTKYATSQDELRVSNLSIILPSCQTKHL